MFFLSICSFSLVYHINSKLLQQEYQSNNTIDDDDTSTPRSTSTTSESRMDSTTNTVNIIHDNHHHHNQDHSAEEEIVPFNRLPYVIGHLHMTKTGGTSLNGELALNYENVCGHKGWSYDNFLVNQRVKENDGDWKHPNDLYERTPTNVKGSRGQVPQVIGNEIGYHDCDFISEERSWKFWKQFDSPPFDAVPMELHVPCREPIDHLMSQCNQGGKNFNCKAKGLGLVREVERCFDGLDQRFRSKLLKMHTVHLKCFDYKRQFSDYIGYITSKLSKKRIQSRYIHRDTNKKRNKTGECIWKDRNLDVKAEVLNILLSHDYYRYCDECIGSADDLFH